MPTVALKCSNCSHTWEDLVGGSTIATQTPECPKCSGNAEKIWDGRAALMAQGYKYPDPNNIQSEDERLEVQMLMEHRQMLEETESTGRDTGRHTVIENGPDWARPFSNRPRERKYY